MQKNSKQMQKNAAIRKARNKGFSKRECLHPEAPKGCMGGIINAHTIQKSGGLTEIAENGHVLTPTVDNASDLTEMKRIGIRQASTFTGFCKLHDNKLFAPIEDRPLELSRRNAFLLAYRSLSRELYAKRRIVETDLLSEVPSHLITRDDKHSQRLLQGSNLLGLHDGAIHARMGNAILKNNFRRTYFYAIETDFIPDVLCSGVTGIEYDFNGQRLQDIAQLKPLDLITLTLLPYKGHGIAVFAWYEKSTVNKRFIESLHSLSKSEIPCAIVRFVFQHFENIFVAPRWWNKLSTNVQKRLLKRFDSSFQPASFLFIDLRPDGVKYVQWKVTNIKTNLTM